MRLRLGRPALVLVAVVGAIAVLAGCSTVVQGSGTSAASASASASGSSTPDFPSGSPGSSGTSGSSGPAANSKYPRTPLTTSIGDPPTADICAALPLSAFGGLGYTPSYSDSAFPPGCSVRLSKGSDIAFSVLAYGIGPDTFSHLGSGSGTTPTRTSTVAGLPVKYYAFSKDYGDCPRDIVGDGVTMKVIVISRALSGKASQKDDCGGADAMVNTLAPAMAKGSVPRLKLATPSLTGLDFCAALRATTLSDLTGFAGGDIAPDGVAAGCQYTRGSNFYFYVDFTLEKTRIPTGTRAKVESGHQLYASTANDNKTCDFYAPQGVTSDGRYEEVSVSSSDYSTAGTAKLCASTATATARFLDAAGLK